MRRMFALLVAVGVLAVAAAWLGLPLFKSASSQPPASEPGGEVRAEVKSFSGSETPPNRYFKGVLEPFAEVELAPRAEGQIVAIKVKKGDRVEKDDLIAQLDYEAQKIAHEQAELFLEDTYDLESARLAYEKAEKDLVRYRRLGKEGIEAPELVEKFELTFAAAELNLKHQQAVLESRQLIVKAREIELEKTRVVAPISGIIAELYLQEGEMALIYGRYPEKPAVAKIVNVDKLIFKTSSVDARFIGQLKKGLRVPLEVELFPGESFVGTVDFISPLIDPKVGDKVVVELVLDNPGHRLLPGMHARVVLEAEK